MNNKIVQFVAMSKYAGMREDIIQAGGGNSSVKLEDDRMLIKASGVQLADLTEESGYTVVNPKVIIEFFNNKTVDEINASDENKLLNDSLISGMRPSIETFLHSITDIFTLHSHPMLVNVLTAREQGIEVLKSLFPHALMVDYATPGINLAKEYFKTYNNANKEKIFDVIFLKNHGLIVSGKTGKEVVEKTEKVLLMIEDYLKVNMQAYHDVTKIFFEIQKISLLKNKIVYLSNDININMSLNKLGGLWNSYFCPDCLVYCGKRPVILRELFTNEDIKKHMMEYGNPVVLYYKEKIYILANNLKKAKEIESVLSFSGQVAVLNSNYKMDLLSDNEQNFLLNWESEKYRQEMK
ncbi:MAG: Methylthioribulose-phosphate dehydratase [Firmicutes bacterium]|nr:Methylthioribulose-phosphate dehydratase [Bacillota bacterium]